MTDTNEQIIDDIEKKIKIELSRTSNERLKFLLTKLIDHFRVFANETHLTTDEWLTTLQFLTTCGQASSSTRQELYLLSDILGLSSLIDSLNHPTSANATPSTVLGPFHTDDAPDVSNGESIASVGKGETCLVLATVRNTDGKPIVGAKIDVWETDDTGHYDNQYENRDRPDMRGRLTSDENGQFVFKCVKPVSYAVPIDGPVGTLLNALNRHAYRPAHIHFFITVPGQDYDDLVTSLFVRGDPYESSDAVFGIKPDLIVDFKKVNNNEIAEKFQVDVNDWLILYDFVLSPRARQS